MTAAQVVLIWNILAITAAFAGAIICFWYAWMCRKDDSLFRIFAAVILLYFGLTYLLALWLPNGESFGVWYLLRSGILTRAGVISLIFLLIAWVFVDVGKCRRE